MKKRHIALLVAAAILAFSSAYSLAAINQVYNINFEWYSQLEHVYSEKIRDISDDRQEIKEKDLKTAISIVNTPDSLKKLMKEQVLDDRAIEPEKLNDNIFICCSLGAADSPEYRIKVADIAQKGNIVEVVVSINTPGEIAKKPLSTAITYHPYDIAMIKKKAFPTAGRLLFIFKNQDGKQLDQQYCMVSRLR